MWSFWDDAAKRTSRTRPPTSPMSNGFFAQALLADPAEVMGISPSTGFARMGVCLAPGCNREIARVSDT